MKNYNDVLNQLQAHGLLVGSLDVGRLVRCKVQGESEKCGWYVLHEFQLTGGDSVLVGTYGVWHGNDNGLMKIELDKSQALTGEQMAAIRKRVAADKKHAELERKRRANIAADTATKAWNNGTAEGHIDYFDKKAVQNYGLRFTKTGAAMVPMLDRSGRIHGLQCILDSEKHKDKIKKLGRNKQYWPAGMMKKGHFHLIGGAPVDVLLIAEGYATAASLYGATGIPVVVAFDANNLLPVAEVLKKHYRGVKLVLCADDDAFSKCIECKKSVNVNASIDCLHCGKPHKKKNTGIETASLAAMQLGEHWVQPRFSDEAARLEHYNKNKGKLTDFNDLHLLEGLHVVRAQIEDAVARFNINRQTKPNTGQNNKSDDESTGLTPIASYDELLDRFSLVYGGKGYLFDHHNHMLVPVCDVRDACLSKETYKRWGESALRKIIMLRNVGFDPSEKDSEILGNLYDGKLAPAVKGNCEKLIELLEYLCSNESDVYPWVLKWLAYPLQHLGAKMKTALVFHGEQGTGKNLFFETIMAIYGRYGRIINQEALDDKYNDHMSAKMFLLADEVVTRYELYHSKNKLKGFITSDQISINPKNVCSHLETNHINFVFLSNEIMPVSLEVGDRRYTVISTPRKLSGEFYKDIAIEIKNGGVEALHDYLLNLPLGDFNEHTKPPLTKAKKELIELGKPPAQKFISEWVALEIENLPLEICKVAQAYEAFNIWCKRSGVRSSCSLTMFSKELVKVGFKKDVVGTENEAGKRTNIAYFTPPKGREPTPGHARKWFFKDCEWDFNKALEAFR